MRHFVFSLFALLLACGAQAELRVFATVPEWAALARELGGDRVKVYSATSAFQDPHRIEAKPSLLAQARQANLVVAAGANYIQGFYFSRPVPGDSFISFIAKFNNSLNQ